MPTRSLNQIDNFDSVKNWLNTNLDFDNPIIPTGDYLVNVPEVKGIYFWFMKSNAYEELREFIDINPLCLKYTIKHEEYDLVYLGTAGVRNNKSGENKGHLKERLSWHIVNNKNITHLCNGSMSTLRRTIGGILSDDLIAEDLQSKLDDFFCKYFIIYYIIYPGTFLEVKDIVNSDEDILINRVRPIFNLKINPNASDPHHVTHLIKQRRNQVNESSKFRWCNNKKQNIIKSKTINIKSKKILVEQNCVEFTLSRNQDISQIADGIENLPVGPCSIELYCHTFNSQEIYINSKKRKINTKSRTVSEYFNAPDTNNDGILKKRIINDEMNKFSIEKITVRVCSLLDNNNFINSDKNLVAEKLQSNDIVAKKNIITNILISKKSYLRNKKVPKLLILTCSDSKTEGGFININPYYNFGINLETLRDQRYLDYNDLLQQNPQYFKDKLQRCILAFENKLKLPAIDRYTRNQSTTFTPGKVLVLKDCIKNKNLHLLILSGLYGVLRHDDQIIDYHMEMNKGGNWFGNIIHDSVNEYIKKNKINNDCVFYSVGSNSSPYYNSLNPISSWTDLWIENGRGHVSSTFWQDQFLTQL